MQKIKTLWALFWEKKYFYSAYGSLWLFLILMSVFYALVAAYFPTQNGDNIEHLHSAFLVAIGQVPYRDFFQHHNPLLWYLFAPLLKLFSYDTTVAEISCVISFLVFLKSLTYVYKIGDEYLGSRFWGLFATAAIAVPGAKFYAIDLRPDNYMTCCFMAGLYYYFGYLKNKNVQNLIVSFFLFVLSFLFAQKSLFPLAVLGITGLYFWYKKEIKTADMLKALILPLLMIFSFFMYLYHYDMIELYFMANYQFNLNLADGFELSKIIRMPVYMIVLMVFAWLGVGAYFLLKNRYLGILSLLFVTEFFERRFYFSPYTYYYWMLCYFGALCSVPVWHYLQQKLRLLVVVLLVSVYVLLIKASVVMYEMAKTEDINLYLPDYVTRHINPCDFVFNGDGMMYNIFGKDPSYYWQLIGQLDVIGEQTGIAPKPNINALIETYKPKFVFGHSYFNKFADEGGHKKIVHYVDNMLLEKYYNATKFYPIYELKPEFRKNKCRWSEVYHEWLYAD